MVTTDEYTPTTDELADAYHTGEVTVDQIEQVLADHTWGGIDTMGRVTCHDSTGGWHVYEGTGADHERHQAEAIAALYEAASRPRMVATVTELDALLDESVLRSHDGRVATKAQNELWWLAGWNAPEYGDALADSDFLPARVLYDPEEAQTTAADADAYRPVERFGAEGGRLLPARTPRATGEGG